MGAASPDNRLLLRLPSSEADLVAADARTFRNEVVRMNRMAVLLAGNGLLPDAPTEGQAAVVSHHTAELSRLTTSSTKWSPTTRASTTRPRLWTG